MKDDTQKDKTKKETCTKHKHFHFTIDSPLSWSLSTATNVFLLELLTTSSAQLLFLVVQCTKSKLYKTAKGQVSDIFICIAD